MATGRISNGRMEQKSRDLGSLPRIAVTASKSSQSGSRHRPLTTSAPSIETKLIGVTATVFRAEEQSVEKAMSAMGAEEEMA